MRIAYAPKLRLVVEQNSLEKREGTKRNIRYVTRRRCAVKMLDEVIYGLDLVDLFTMVQLIKNAIM